MAHPFPFLLLEQGCNGCRYLKYIQIFIQFYSVTELLGFFFSSLKFNYSCAKGKTRYFHHPFSPRTIVHLLIDTLLRHIKVFLNVEKEEQVQNKAEIFTINSSLLILKRHFSTRQRGLGGCVYGTTHTRTDTRTHTHTHNTRILYSPFYVLGTFIISK